MDKRLKNKLKALDKYWIKKNSMTLDSQIKFGKYKACGYTLQTLCELDPSYVVYMIEQGYFEVDNDAYSFAYILKERQGDNYKGDM